MHEVTVIIKIDRSAGSRIEIEEHGFVTSQEPLPGIDHVVKQAANRAKAAAWIRGGDVDPE